MAGENRTPLQDREGYSSTTGSVAKTGRQIRKGTHIGNENGKEMFDRRVKQARPNHRDDKARVTRNGAPYLHVDEVKLGYGREVGGCMPSLEAKTVGGMTMLRNENAAREQRGEKYMADLTNAAAPVSLGATIGPHDHTHEQPVPDAARKPDR